MESKLLKLRYFVYARKSTEEEERQVLSIETQIEKAKEIFGDVEIVEVLEERKSAFVPKNRPVFEDMLRRIEKGDADGIIAWHPDRLSRCELDAAEITYRVRTGKIKDLKFGSYHFTNGPEGIMMLQLALSQSQYSSAKLSTDAKRGLEKKVKMGWLPGVAPEGYLNNKYKDKGEKDVVKDPDRFHLIRKMWDLMFTGNYTPPQILKIANEQWGYTTVKRKKVGGGPMARSTIYKIFTNPYYAGVIRFKGQEYQGAHEPMITLEEFDYVQELLGRKGKPRQQKHLHTFTGCLRCKECGCSVTASVKSKYIKSLGEIKVYRYYHCTKKKESVRCSQSGGLSEDQMKLQIEDELGQLTILPEFLEWALEAINTMNDKEVKERKAIQESQYKEIVTTQTDLDNLMRARYRGEVDDEEFFTKERDELRKKLNRIKEAAHDTEERAEKWLELTERTFNFATYALIHFDKGDLYKKKEIFTTLGSNFVLFNGKIEIEPYEWFVPIKNYYPELEAEYLRLEPNREYVKAGSNNEQSAALTALRTRWLPTSDDIRKISHACNDSAPPDQSTHEKHGTDDLPLAA